MADIISLESKLKLSDKKREKLDRQRKMKMVQKMLRLSQSNAKCEKCGIRINPDSSTIQHHLRVPYHFCPDCSEEYIEYIEQLKGNGNPDNYWHNGVWQRVWRAWIDYRNTIDQFVRSKEFRRLLKETKPQ
jgi:predicted RNA-binding Zn-ribbon protein involved in translation (DUF1610 family)